MAAGMQFVVSGDKMAARNIVLGVFQQHQWRAELKNDWEGTVEHGSKSASFWGGAFAGKGGRHVILNLTVSPSPDGNTMITLIEATSGISGGVIGVTQAKEVYQVMYNHVGMALSNAGIHVKNIKI